MILQLFNHSKQCPLLLVVLCALWTAMCWASPVADFHNPFVQTAMLCAYALTVIMTFVAPATAVRISSPVCFGLFAWGLTEWAYSPWHGHGSLMILLLFALFVMMGDVAVRSLRERDSAFAPRVVLAAIAAVATVSAVYGLMQYGWLYDTMLARVIQENRGQQLDAVGEGILHHLKLKRVASFYGDPNIFGTILALGMLATAELVRGMRHGRKPLQLKTQVLIGVPLLALQLWALVLTGSRGAMLAMIIGLQVWALGIIFWRRILGGHTPDLSMPLRRAAWVLVCCVATYALAGALISQPTRHAYRQQLAGHIFTETVPEVAFPTAQPSPDTNPEASALTRMGTIRERQHYLTIGWRIFTQAPLTILIGGGTGAVETQYGYFKPVEARETKYLHNWPIQWLAETGIIGTALYVLLLAGVLLSAWQARLFRHGAWYAVAVGAGVILVDGLWSLSLTHPAVAAMLGLFLGMMCGASADEWATSRLAKFGAKLATVSLLLLLSLCYQVSAHSVFATAEMREALKQNDLKYAQHLEQTATDRAHAWQYHAARADYYETVGNHKEALGWHQLLVSLDALTPAAHANLVEYYLRNGNTSKIPTQQIATNAVNLSPTKPEYRDLLSRALEADGDTTAALHQARLAAELTDLWKDRYAARVKTLEAKLNSH